MEFIDREIPGHCEAAEAAVAISYRLAKSRALRDRHVAALLAMTEVRRHREAAEGGRCAVIARLPKAAVAIRFRLAET
ncbi:MAG: hypothetical protein U5K38_10070 [Woeseiaceae bacterium]|nr:hypothetical protein [Woeseiaceae bacterium]